MRTTNRAIAGYKKKFQDINGKLYVFEKSALEKVIFWKRLHSSFESAVDLYREYGRDFLDLDWANLHEVIENVRFSKYFSKREGVEDLRAQLDQFLINEIKIFGGQITDFWSEFVATAQSWQDKRNNSIQYRGLIVSLIGIFTAVIADTILTIIQLWFSAHPSALEFFEPM